MIKVKKRKILLLPGDGIGPEVVEEVKKVINPYKEMIPERIIIYFRYHVPTSTN